MEASVARVNSLFTSRKARAFTLMCVTLGSVFLIDLFMQYQQIEVGTSAIRTPLYIIRGLFATNVPHFTALYLIRSLLIALGTATFVAALSEPRDPASMITAQVTNEPTELMFKRMRFWIWLVIAMGAVSLVTFIVQPKIFSRLAVEDGVVETFSALGYFASVIVLISTSFVLLRRNVPYRKLSITLALGGAFVLFIMGGEEISWGQRIFDIATPDTFVGNHQGEMNLHNFAANTLESIFYFLATVWLVIIPFINSRTGFFQRFRPLALFVPAQFLIFIGVLATAYNYDKWDIGLMQFCFFISLFVLLQFQRDDSRAVASKEMVIALIVLLVGSQIAFIAFGNNLRRVWDPTEYREMFIPFGYMVYSLDVFQRARHTQSIAKTTTAR
ncbi:hypothetical protein EKD04_016310 [Chloroflexales bacterium ZM16-3]|nr:hypothetical protein [Chloroflexales bacterium ZM16-3]